MNLILNYSINSILPDNSDFEVHFLKLKKHHRNNWFA